MCSPDPGPQKKRRIQTGRSFEKQAALFFEQNGYTILERNWQAGHKEIDIIVRKDDLIVFVEVKSASSGKFGHPAERVDRKKVANLTTAAHRYISEHNIENCDLRFDVVTFVDGKLEYFPNAFEAAQ